MPTYEYECEQCGHQFEQFQGMSDPPIMFCPKCLGKIHRIIFGGSGFIMKGSKQKIMSMPSCGRESTCCGKDTPCETKPCEK